MTGPEQSQFHVAWLSGTWKGCAGNWLVVPGVAEGVWLLQLSKGNWVRFCSSEDCRCSDTPSERCGAFLGLVISNWHNTFSVLD